MIRGMGEELISTQAQKDGAQKQVGVVCACVCLCIVNVVEEMNDSD